MSTRPSSAAVLLLAFAMPVCAQQSARFSGDYAGTLGPMPVRLHITGSGSALSGTIDSPSQNMFGLKCTDVQANGKSLSFSVPAVNGTWVGFLSDDGSLLSGMWNQGSTTQLNLTRVSSNGSVTASSSPGEVKWDDYTFMFVPDGRTGQVLRGGQAVGVIITINGAQQVAGPPGPELDRLKKSFADYQVFMARTHSGGATAPAPVATATAIGEPSAPPTAAPATPLVPGTSGITAAAETASERVPVASIQFDEATHSIVVPRPDGTLVTFSGQDVKIGGSKRGGYILRHQKGSAGRFLEHSLEHNGAVGGSISGGGVEFLREGGGIIFDSGMGAYGNWQENPYILDVKRLSIIAVAAVTDVRQAPGHENFTPPGYDTLKELSQLRLRSDGSR